MKKKSKKKIINNQIVLNKPAQKSFNLEAIIFLIGIFCLVLLDVITKRYLYFSQKNIDLIILKLKTTTNTGASFGILQGFNIVLIIVSIIVITLLIINYKNIPKFSMLFISSGIIGNLFDRISLGYVIDFIDFGFWPVFNLADSFITVGVTVWIIKLFIDEVNIIKLKKKI